MQQWLIIYSANSLICLQFPIRLCFAVTSNKSQGQTLKHVGIYLQQDFFSHGQLYVALSRVQSPQNLRIYRPHDADKNTCETTNVVFKEVLLCNCLRCKATKVKVSIVEVILHLIMSKIYFLSNCRLNIRNLCKSATSVKSDKSHIWKRLL